MDDTSLVLIVLVAFIGIIIAGFAFRGRGPSPAKTDEARLKLEQEVMHQQARIRELEANLRTAQYERDQKMQDLQEKTHLIGASSGKIQQLETLIKSLQSSLAEREKKVLELNNEISSFKATEHEKIKHYQEQIGQLNKLFQTYEAEKDRVRKEAQSALDLKLQEREKQWQTHEARVKEEIRVIALRCGVEIPKTYPFKGEPDNVIMIKKEYVVFDAKSPRNVENPERFDRYLAEQAKSCCKYTDEPNVRKEAFLVVPDDALPYIKNFVHQKDETRVYVIPLCAVEPLIRNLQLIENYEFAEELSPEDRDCLIHFIGKSVHTMKRRVQIDQFFAQEIFKLIDDKDHLPEEFKTEAQKYEDSINLNPPREIGKKVIKNSDLKDGFSDIDHIMRDAG